MNEAVCMNSHDTSYQRNLICPVQIHLQPEQTLPDIQSVSEAKSLISKAKGEGVPYFIAVGLHKPHIPYRYPLRFKHYHAIEKFQTNDFDHIRYGMPTVAFNPFNDLRRRVDVQQLNVSYPFGPIEKNFAWEIRQSYYASVTYIDDLIGQLMASVNLADTIIVLTSDHGYSLGEHAEWAKYTNYEIGVRVPLIIYSPSFRLQRVRKLNQIAELIDLFPTLVDLAALPHIEHCSKFKPMDRQLCTEGKSLLPLITSEANWDESEDVAISQYPRPSIYPTEYPDSDQPNHNEIKIMGYSIRTQTFRYTIWLEFDAKHFTRSKCI